MRFFATLTCFLFLASCGADRSDEADNSSTTSPRPSGIELSGMDTSVPPQENFFNYTNGNWLKNTEIPADKSSWGSFNIVNEKTLDQLHTIIEESAQSQNNGDVSARVTGAAKVTGAENDLSTKNDVRAKIGAFYRAWLNEAEVAKQALSPIASELKAIEQARNHNDIIALFALFNSIGVDSPLNFWIDQDARDSTQYIAYISQSGLGLPDRDYYFDDTERGKEILVQYRAFITKLLTLAGSTEPEQAAARIIDLEMRLAEHHWTNVRNRDSELTYNKYSAEQLTKTLSDYNFAQYMSGTGIDAQPNYIVRQPSYIAALNDLVTTVDLRSWQDYLRFNVLVSFAPYLPKTFEQAHFDFYNTVLSGQPEQQVRWKLAINSINENMGELLGQLYVARYFPPEAKARMTKLVDNLITAYRSSIMELDWMGPETREKALIKLDQFTPKIGYPDKWKDYSNLILTDTDLAGNIKRARMFNHYLEIDKLGRAVDRSEWFMAPQKVNAYYNPGMNEIVFPAAILQPPFFNIEADDAVNYGAIGGVIGHEIGHGFDDQGSKYNGEGNLQNWWTEEDRKSFEQRTGQLIRQYAAYEVLPGLFINGDLTLGENIGDLGGVSIALKAYQLSLGGKPAPKIDGFSGEQRVFLGWAQAWRVKLRPKLAERLVKTDPHSPPEYRVNGVLPNIDAFYTAFDVKPEDALYQPPEQRVKIW